MNPAEGSIVDETLIVIDPEDVSVFVFVAPVTDGRSFLQFESIVARGIDTSMIEHAIIPGDRLILGTALIDDLHRGQAT